MIPFDFEYYKPDNIKDAAEAYQAMQKQGKKVMYYGGGTEFITLARLNHIQVDSVIDLKGIPECRKMEAQNGQIVIGAAVTLNQITEAKLFPLLGETVKHVADHTSRNKITIGGNLHSRLMYREGVLPLLLADAQLTLADSEGEATIPLTDVFTKELQLKPGQFLVNIIIEKEYASLPYVCLKKTKISKVSYPIVTIAALAKDQQIRAAFSGVIEYPFRSGQIDRVLNDTALLPEERIEKALGLLPASLVNDIHASSGYREFVFKNALQETLKTLQEVLS